MAIELSNGLTWSSQENAKQHFCEILGRYADDEIIGLAAQTRCRVVDRGHWPA